MTKAEKKRFIRELCGNVAKEAQEKVSRMPESWDGIELRQYLADKFADAVMKGTMSPTRRRAYNNEVIVSNL
jgi:hypothetical protein